MSTTNTAEQKRGSGTLFKRGKKGYFYLRFYVDGKQTAQRLTDEHGNPITIEREAKKAQQDFLAPLQSTKKADQLKAIRAKLEDVEQQRQEALKALKSSLPLANAWKEYHGSQNRPKSGASTLNRYKATIDAFNECNT